MKLAIYAITEHGAALARQLGAALPAADIWLPERLRAADRAHYTPVETTALLPQLFARYNGLICIMATGIVVRALAPVLRGKEHDPAVVVLDEAGRFCISLLSGHLGGANDLARRIAAVTGGTAVVTTATDVHGLLAWDEAARRAGLVIESIPRIKRLNALLLRGEKIALVDSRERIAPWFIDTPGVMRVNSFSEAHKLQPAGRVFVTHRLIPKAQQDESLLLLRPRDLVVGIGCNRGTPTREISEAVKTTLQNAFLALASVAGLATIQAKADEDGLLAFAREQKLPLEIHDSAALNAVDAPAEPSPYAQAAVGANGVCEPAAILSAGHGPLLVGKQRIGNVTVAVAEKA